MSDNAEKYIEEHWDECIKENTEDKDTLIGMPYPYTVPSVGHFDEMYYWDTYFTNKGLEYSGNYSQVKNNTDNMLYLIDKYGFMPNGNRTYYLSNSQPPFLSLMVSDVYKHYKDRAWLRGAYYILEKEYKFWMTKRCSEMGLNFYSGNLTEKKARFFGESISDRIGYMPEGDIKMLGMHHAACCESGWDLTMRWGMEAYNYAPVDLNSLMYAFEKNMSYFSKELDNENEDIWERRAEKRRQIMLDCMDSGNGILLDYNFVSKELSKVFSAASYYPLFTRLADERHARAAADNLYRLETDYGILTCEKNDIKGTYQWGYPNGWACLQYIAFIGFDNYGYKTEARRIADKYVRLVERVFDETGNLWEKYNVVEGNINVKNEYDMPKMMGWSAGVYLAAKSYLKSQ